MLNESEVFIVRCHIRSPGQLVFKKAWTRQWFQESIFKVGEGEASQRYVMSSCTILIDWWWGNRVVSQGLTSSVLRLKYAWLCAHCNQIIIVFHLVEVLVSDGSMQETQERQIGSLGQGDPLEEINDYPLQYSCLKNPMDWGAWWATVQIQRVGHD